MQLFDRRYRQGAFGFGPSHDFDITVALINGIPTVFHPDGIVRQLPTPNPAQSKQFLGTGGLPADPLAGFLPPNNASNQGTGYVTFSVKPKTGLANGTTITNQASIVFDVNVPIGTNSVTNTIDSVYPTSSVSSLPAVTTTASFTVSWSGSDPAGAGIASYNIFSSVNSGSYSLWIPATTATSATYSGAISGNTYSFYSPATDNAGRSQQAAGPVQTTTVTLPTLQSIAVSPANSAIGVGMTQQFIATGIYSDKSTQNLTAQVTWSSGTLPPLANPADPKTPAKELLAGGASPRRSI